MPEPWFYKNKDAYSSAKVVASYAGQSYIEPCEDWFIRQFENELRQWDMLDIAVGAGRTSRLFAPLVKRYVALDYSPAMIEECNKTLVSKLPHSQFMLADMSDLGVFEDNCFDFVLISFNAISALPAEQRRETICESFRVLRPGGRLFFSAHNLQAVRRLASLKSVINPTDPRKTAHNIIGLFRLLFVHNSPKGIYSAIRDDKYALINDGAHDGSLIHYYIKPTYQILQLQDLFRDIRILRRDGREITGTEELHSVNDSWLFYLATAAK